MLAVPLQRCTPTQQLGIPAAVPGDDHHAKLAARLRYATPATQLGRETGNALAFDLDQSTGASQSVEDNTATMLNPCHRKQTLRHDLLAARLAVIDAVALPGSTEQALSPVLRGKAHIWPATALSRERLG